MLHNNSMRSQYNVSGQYGVFDGRVNTQHIGRIEDEILEKVSQLTSKPQWILLTAECPRPSVSQIMHFHKLGNHMVQMKPSVNLSQYQVVEKAIRSGNACAVIANGCFSQDEQRRLSSLATHYHCEVIFLSLESYLH